jgi:two-component sensor histidine kinase
MQKFVIYSVLFLGLLLSPDLSSRNSKTDSLEVKLKSAKDTSKVNILNELAKAYQKSDTNKILIYAEKARALAKKLNYKSGYAIALCNIGIYHIYKEENKKAVEFFNLSLKSADELDEKTVLKLLSTIAINHKDSALKIRTYKQAIKLAEKIHSDKTGIIYHNLAYHYFNLSDHKTSFHYFLKGLQASEKSKNKYSIMINADGMANILEAQGNEKATTYKKIALEMAEKLNNTEYKAWVRCHFIVYYRKQQQYDTAISIGYEAIRLAKPIDDNLTLSQAFSEVGYAFYLKGDKEKAIGCYHQGLAYLKNLHGSKNLLITLLYRLGQGYTASGKYKQAFSYLNQAIEEAKYINAKNELLPVYRELSYAYFTTCDFKKAYIYNDLYHILKDSIYSLENKEQIAGIITRYEVEKKEQSIKILEQENKIKDLKISQSNTQFIVVTALCLFILVIALLIYFRYRVHVKAGKIMKQVNKEILKANSDIRDYANEKEVLLQEIHHRVKNNLQLISSIFNWQAENVTDERLLQIIAESRSRIKSIALVHESLYQANNFSHLNFKEYLEDLLTYLDTIYNKNKNICLTKNIQPLLINLDVIVPIGLIVTELVSNSFKHAFPCQIKGEIEVVLTEDEPHVYTLQVKDNGVGFPEKIIPGNRIQTMGLELVKILVRQIKGRMCIHKTSGTFFSISFNILHSKKNTRKNYNEKYQNINS